MTFAIGDATISIPVLLVQFLMSSVILLLNHYSDELLRVNSFFHVLLVFVSGFVY